MIPGPILMVLACSVGLAFAGALVATVGLITHQKLSFDLFFRNGRRGVLALPLLVMAGPALLLQSLGPMEGEAPVPPRFAIPAYAIAGAWSLACGHALLRLSVWVSATLF